VSKDARRPIRVWIYGGSVVLHAAFALGAVLLPAEQKTESVAIELADIRKKNERPKPPPPVPPPPKEKPKPPPPPPKPQTQAKIAAEAPKAETPPPLAMGSDGYADLGIALGNGGGADDGVALAGPARGAGADGLAGAGASSRPTATRKVVQQLSAATGAEACNEPPLRPKRKIPVAPKYTMQARQAEIEGVVRIEVTVDETGRVLSARVLSGLGYGLDEAAVEAAKASVFEPATRCGRRIVGTVVLPFRFEST
jgi:protein TonB